MQPYGLLIESFGCVFCIQRQCCLARRERVAGVRCSQQRTALNNALRIIRSLRKGQPAHVAGIRWVGEDKNARSTGRLRKLRFVTPEVTTVARQHDLAVDRYAHRLELLEIFLTPVVGVDDFARHIT